jgi:hypothetical protein
MSFHSADHEIRAKVVLFGPPRSGKATFLRYLARVLESGGESQMTTLRTDDDRIIALDALPREAPVIGGRRVRLRLCTATGTVRYETTWRQLLDGADAVIFLAHGGEDRGGENLAAVRDLRRFAASTGAPPPTVFAFNRSLGAPPRALEREAALNDTGMPAIDVDAAEGPGVAATFAAAVRFVFDAAGPGLGAEAAKRLGALRPAN